MEDASDGASGARLERRETRCGGWDETGTAPVRSGREREVYRTCGTRKLDLLGRRLVNRSRHDLWRPLAAAQAMVTAQSRNLLVHSRGSWHVRIRIRVATSPAGDPRPRPSPSPRAEARALVPRCLCLRQSAVSAVSRVTFRQEKGGGVANGDGVCPRAPRAQCQWAVRRGPANWGLRLGICCCCLLG